MKSPIVRQGGKYRLLKRLNPLVPDHEVYIEAFAGAAWLFFSKEPARIEVLNDADGGLITFYRVVAYHEPEFSHWLRFMPRSAQIWEEIERQPELTDVQRAVVWYFRNKTSFGGRGEHFGRHRKASTPLHSLPTDFLSVSDRLNGVCIEHGDFEWVIKYYDQPGAFFFLDPPYLGTNQDSYRVEEFTGKDADRLRKTLETVKGNVLITVGGPEAKRYIPAGWIVEQAKEAYSMSKVGDRHANNPILIARNYEIEPAPPMNKRAAKPRPKPSDEYKSPYVVVKGNEAQKCNYPARLDPYGRGCEHGCLYCYARSVLEFRGLWHDEPASADPAKVRVRVAKELFKAGSPVWGRLPLRIGGMTDAFQPVEATKRVTEAVLELLNEYKAPYLIVTKGALVGEYIDKLDADLANIQVTVPTPDAEIARQIEPGASPPAERLKAMRKLTKAGIHTTLRLSPVVWGEWVDADGLRAMLKAGKPGTLLVEFLRVNHHITARLGEYIDLAPYTLKAHGYRHLPVKTKERVLEEIAAVCAAEGVELSVCEDEDAAYEGLKRFWANPADCCNLKGVARMKQKKAS